MSARGQAVPVALSVISSDIALAKDEDSGKRTKKREEHELRQLSADEAVSNRTKKAATNEKATSGFPASQPIHSERSRALGHKRHDEPD